MDSTETVTPDGLNKAGGPVSMTGLGWLANSFTYKHTRRHEEAFWACYQGYKNSPEGTLEAATCLIELARNSRKTHRSGELVGELQKLWQQTRQTRGRDDEGWSVTNRLLGEELYRNLVDAGWWEESLTGYHMLIENQDDEERSRLWVLAGDAPWKLHVEPNQGLGVFGQLEAWERTTAGQQVSVTRDQEQAWEVVQRSRKQNRTQQEQPPQEQPVQARSLQEQRRDWDSLNGNPWKALAALAGRGAQAIVEEVVHGQSPMNLERFEDADCLAELAGLCDASGSDVNLKERALRGILASAHRTDTHETEERRTGEQAGRGIHKNAIVDYVKTMTTSRMIYLASDLEILEGNTSWSANGGGPGEVDYTAWSWRNKLWWAKKLGNEENIAFRSSFEAQVTEARRHSTPWHQVEIELVWAETVKDKTLAKHLEEQFKNRWDRKNAEKAKRI